MHLVRTTPLRDALVILHPALTMGDGILLARSSRRSALRLGNRVVLATVRQLKRITATRAVARRSPAPTGSTPHNWHGF